MTPKVPKKYRTERSNLVSRTCEGRNGWFRDPHEAKVIPDWAHRFPNLPLVADGREETGYSRAGRGTTAFDLFRRVDIGGIYRVDFLSIKTDTIGSDGKLPSKLELSTGRLETLVALLEGIHSGSALPTVVFVSENDEFGEPLEDGFAIFLDLAPILRRGIASIEHGPYAKGKAPEAYFKWSSARPCGGKSKHLVRADREFPYVDEENRRWISPDKVCYPELVVSLSSLGLRRSDWRPINVRDLPEFVQAQDWDMMAYGPVQVR